MRIRSIYFDDKETPIRVTAVVSLDEATQIALTLGRYVQTPVVELTLSKAAELVRKYGELTDATGRTKQTSEIRDCLNRMVFNNFWENGIQDVAA